MRRRMMSSAKEMYIWHERWNITIALALCLCENWTIKELIKMDPIGEIKDCVTPEGTD